MAISAEKRMEAVVSCVMNDSASRSLSPCCNAKFPKKRHRHPLCRPRPRNSEKGPPSSFPLVLPLLSHFTLRCFRRESFATTSLARENLHVRRRRRRRVVSGSVGPDSESPEPQFVCRRSWIGERSREERVGVEESERSGAEAAEGGPRSGTHPLQHQRQSRYANGSVGTD